MLIGSKDRAAQYDWAADREVEGHMIMLEKPVGHPAFISHLRRKQG